MRAKSGLDSASIYNKIKNLIQMWDISRNSP
jgi:hypothetical protein